MKFKTSRIEKQWIDAAAVLKIITLYFEELSVEAFGIEPTITRIKDPIENESGVHPAGRAIDIRDHYKGEATYDEWQAEMLLKIINNRFKRYDELKTIIHHSFGDGPKHFHVQVPYLTTALKLI